MHMKGRMSVALSQASEEFKSSKSSTKTAVENGLGSYHTTLVEAFFLFPLPHPTHVFRNKILDTIDCSKQLFFT